MQFLWAIPAAVIIVDGMIASVYLWQKSDCKLSNNEGVK